MSQIARAQCLQDTSTVNTCSYDLACNTSNRVRAASCMQECQLQMVQYFSGKSKTKMGNSFDFVSCCFFQACYVMCTVDKQIVNTPLKLESSRLCDQFTNTNRIILKMLVRERKVLASRRVLKLRDEMRKSKPNQLKVMLVSSTIILMFQVLRSRETSF